MPTILGRQSKIQSTGRLKTCQHFPKAYLLHAGDQSNTAHRS